jgi:hypothetical protein
VLRIYRDETAWSGMREAGLAYVEEQLFAGRDPRRPACTHWPCGRQTWLARQEHSAGVRFEEIMRENGELDRPGPIEKFSAVFTFDSSRLSNEQERVEPGSPAPEAGGVR